MQSGGPLRSRRAGRATVFGSGTLLAVRYFGGGHGAGGRRVFDVLIHPAVHFPQHVQQ